MVSKRKSKDEKDIFMLIKSKIDEHSDSVAVHNNDEAKDKSRQPRYASYKYPYVYEALDKSFKSLYAKHVIYVSELYNFATKVGLNYKTIEHLFYIGDFENNSIDSEIENYDVLFKQVRIKKKFSHRVGLYFHVSSPLLFKNYMYDMCFKFLNFKNKNNI